MSASAFAAVMSGLERLTEVQLTAVASAALALGGSAPPKLSGSGRQRTASASKAGGKKKKTKGPAKQVSKYADVKEYKDYKASEKVLRTFLRQEGKVLSEYDPNADNLPVAVAGFLEARQCFFRYKTSTLSDGGAERDAPARSPSPAPKRAKPARASTRV